MLTGIKEKETFHAACKNCLVHEKSTTDYTTENV